MSSCYPVEFKQKAVELVTTQRKSITQVSRDLNIAKPALYYLLNNQNSSSRALASGRPTMDPAQENRHLRARKAAMKNGLDVLRAEHEDIKKENRAAKLVIEYLGPAPHVISQMRRSREKNLKYQIEKLRALHSRSLGYRPIHVLMMKKGISYSLHLVRKVMKLAGFFDLPKKRKYPKGNYSPEIGNFIGGNSQSITAHEKWFIDITQKRYLSGTIYLAAIRDAAPGWWWAMRPSGIQTWS